MKKEMTLKEFLDKAFEDSPIKALGVAEKMIQLSAIEDYINLCFGVELEIKVRPAKRKEGRFYGTGVIEKLF